MVLKMGIYICCLINSIHQYMDAGPSCILNLNNRQKNAVKVAYNALFKCHPKGVTQQQNKFGVFFS